MTNNHRGFTSCVALTAASLCLLMAAVGQAEPKKTLTWAGFFGGTQYDDCASVAVDSKGNIVVVGQTSSTDLATTGAAEDRTYNGGTSDAFVAYLSPAGQVIWMTYLGGQGADTATGVVVDDDDSIYVVGSTDSTDFPALNGWDTSPNGDLDVFVAKYHPTGSLLRTTFLGGSSWDEGLAIATDNPKASIMVTGRTYSTDFPFSYGAFPYPSGYSDGFVTCLGNALDLKWSTYLGGNDQSDTQDEAGIAIAVSATNEVYVAGRTCAPDFPSANGADKSLDGDQDAFLTKFTAEGVLLWSRYFGGNDFDQANAVIVDAVNRVYLTGYTTSTSGLLAASGGYDRTLAGGQDAFLAQFDANGNLLWSTYLGGGADDDWGLALVINAAGHCVAGGMSSSADFPRLSPVQPGSSGNIEMFLSEFGDSGQLLWSTLLGGDQDDYAMSLTRGGSGRLLLGGSSDSTKGFPPIDGQPPSGQHGDMDAFLATLTDLTAAAPEWRQAE